MAALFGDAAAAALDAATVPRSGETERAILASYLFEPPAVLADEARARSAGPDGTVDIEEHAGLESELEAAADWVARAGPGRHAARGHRRARARDRSARRAPGRAPGRLPWPDGPLPVHVAGGLPFGGTATGARTLAVVRALRGHLSGELLAAVLPSLRTMPAGARHLSHGGATDLAWSLGTVGGNPAHPHGALEWVPRMTRSGGEPRAAARARARRRRRPGARGPGAQGARPRAPGRRPARDPPRGRGAGRRGRAAWRRARRWLRSGRGCASSSSTGCCSRARARAPKTCSTSGWPAWPPIPRAGASPATRRCG